MSGSSAENIYDVIVVGTGPIGQTVADRTCAAGLSVAAVERGLVGSRPTVADPQDRTHARGEAEPDMQAITILGGNR